MSMKSSPAAFAVLDILGYGDLMKANPEDVFPVIQKMVQSSEDLWHIQMKTDKIAKFSGCNERPEIKCIQFSDTLLIWIQSAPGANIMLNSPMYLVSTIGYATAFVLSTFIGAGLPLRGAIGFGDIFVSQDPMFFTGYQLYQTMELEKQQCWAGAILHESAIKHVNTHDLDAWYVEYDVPCKFGLKNCTAVNWASMLSIHDSIILDPLAPLPISESPIPDWESMFVSDNESVCAKKLATKKFYCDQETVGWGLDIPALSEIRKFKANVSALRNSKSGS